MLSVDMQGETTSAVNVISIYAGETTSAINFIGRYAEETAFAVNIISIYAGGGEHFRIIEFQTTCLRLCDMNAIERKLQALHGKFASVINRVHIA